MIIKLIRHGQSESNTGSVLTHHVGDHKIHLTQEGISQAKEVGEKIGKEFIENSLFYRSPYARTRETSIALMHGAGITEQEIKVMEDPRLREAERGYVDSESQHAMRQLHGWFYYRYSGGESPADVYDRSSAFMESVMRQIKRNQKDNILIVAHGMTIRCLIARFLHLTVEQFEQMKNPKNCSIITILPTQQNKEPTIFKNKKWAVVGDLELYHSDPEPINILNDILNLKF